MFRSITMTSNTAPMQWVTEKNKTWNVQGVVSGGPAGGGNPFTAAAQGGNGLGTVGTLTFNGDVGKWFTGRTVTLAMAVSGIQLQVNLPVTLPAIAAQVHALKAQARELSDNLDMFSRHLDTFFCDDSGDEESAGDDCEPMTPTYASAAAQNEEVGK